MEDIILDNAFTVSQINRYIKERIAADENLRAFTIKGEISNFTNHKTGHFYFTLKDNASSIRAIMFKTAAQKVRFRVENGMNVIIRGSIQVFERDGAYQLYCETLEPDGIGALYLAFEQLKVELAKKGLFDDNHKKPIPQFPQKIGVVTSKTGAAIHDIINVLSRRYPIATLCLFPALVQGENAPQSIVAGIKAAEKQGDIDVLIVGRGGGSIEDLWCFNDEKVAYAVYDCDIPIISAVGHEVDFSICDFVADLRAPTPSAAAELCAPDIAAISEKINTSRYLLYNAAMRRIMALREQLKADYGKLNTYSPQGRITLTETELAAKKARLNHAMEALVSKNEQRMTNAVSTLEALSPLKVMTRGYSITRKNGKIVASVSELAVGDTLSAAFVDGEATVAVEKIKKNSPKRAKKEI